MFLLSCNSDQEENNSIPEDTTPPEITLIGDATINLTFGTAYAELNATATDDVDGDISSNIVIGGATVNSDIPNTYIITYDVSDAAGNAADQVLRTVNVLPDSNQPVIMIIGEATIELAFSEAYEELGAAAVDDIDGDISSEIVIGGATVDSTIPNTYIITYDVSDAAGNAADQVLRTVNVLPNTSPPVITLIGEATIELAFGEAYEELGATAVDDIDGDISSEIVIGGDVVDPNVSGSYEITYNVSDSSENAAEQVIRTVNVIPDTSPPVITLIGEATIEHTFGETYEESGATAVDDSDGDISSEIVIGGDVVNPNISGSYEITYNVSDQSGNMAEEVVRMVNVAEGSSSTIIAECHLFSYNSGVTSLRAKLRFDINGRISSVEEVITGTEYFYNFDSNGKLTSIIANGTPFIEVFYDANDRITQINDRTFVFNPIMSDYINDFNFNLSNAYSNGYDNHYLEDSSISSTTQGLNIDYTFNVLTVEDTGYIRYFKKDLIFRVSNDGSTSLITNPDFGVLNVYNIRYDENDLLRQIGVDYSYEGLVYWNSTINPLHQSQTNLLQIFSFLQPYRELYKTNILFNIHLFSNLNINQHYLDEGPYTMYGFGYSLNNLGMPASSTRAYLVNSGTWLVYSHIEANYYYQGDEIPD
ncbi:immunoglobulin-like domain-containing protein [Psychroserpens jangbogonensis]|uniref:immunoglobulin-like domain-containing protein n=1 Tax=Psychroserpens jangbogonensis TaxID=1484460 RepID=UPI000B116107|nr:DUF5011 domain-containing protein [Psychroserpens jangbogonensis]